PLHAVALAAARIASAAIPVPELFIFRTTQVTLRRRVSCRGSGNVAVLQPESQVGNGADEQGRREAADTPEERGPDAITSDQLPGPEAQPQHQSREERGRVESASSHRSNLPCVRPSASPQADPMDRRRTTGYVQQSPPTFHLRVG